MFGPILDGPNGYNLYIILALMTAAFHRTKARKPTAPSSAAYSSQP